MPKVKATRYFVYLFLIFILGFLLRVVAINYGYPFVFHPDEPTIIRSALGIRFEANPKHFDWPHLYIYFNYFVYMIFTKIRALFTPVTLSILWDDSWIFYPLTRLVSALFGICTIFPLYLAGRDVFNKKTGIFAALALAVIPFHVVYSHYALVEAAMVFFLSWGVYFTSKILITKYQSMPIKYYVLSGLFIGLAASTKYNGGLTAVMVPLATLLSLLATKKTKNIKEFLIKFLSLENFKDWSVSGFFALLGFLIGTPFALFDYDTFTRTDGPKGALWQFTNVGSVSFIEQVNGFFYNIGIRVSTNMGHTVIFGFVIVFLLLLYKLIKPKALKYISDNDVSILSFLFIMSFGLLWYVSGFKNDRAHYHFISYPFIILIFAYFVNLLTKIKVFYVSNLFVLLSFLIPLVMSANLSFKYYNGDTRIDLYNWLKNNPEYAKQPIVYVSSELTPIFKKAKVPQYDNSSVKLKYNKGLLILNERDKLPKGINNLAPVVEINNQYKRWYKIDIYTFEQ